MSKQRELSNKIRTYHRYLGFFLAGIMAVYALSGVLLIFRDTDFLKKEIVNEKQVETNLNAEQLGKTTKRLPLLLDKMAHMHKAKSADPLFFLNIFFGVALLFFVVSAFWMFLPNTTIFKKGMYFAAAGIVLTLILLLV